MPCIFLDNAPAYILRDSLSLGLEPVVWTRVADPELQGSVYLCLPIAGFTDVGAMDINSDVHFI